MNTVSLLGFLFALFAVAVQVTADFTNENVLRTIDLTGNGIARLKVSAKIANSGKTTASAYLILVDADLADNLSYIAATIRPDIKNSEPIPLSIGAPSDSKNGFVTYSAALAYPLNPGKSAIIEISFVYTQVIRPLPKVIGQNDEQWLLFSFNAYSDSAYVAKKQKTTIRLPSSEIHPPAGPGPIQKKGSSVIFGPYTDIAPGQGSVASVHYKDNKPILVAKTLSRELELSHWGSNLGVTEYYDLFHRGAELRNKLFSRVDFQFAAQSRGSRSNVVEHLRVILPPKASHVYYRDDIGNVSTSNFRKSLTRDSIMDIKPRYPLYGGWKYNWHHTYDVPLNDYLKKDTKTGQYVLQVLFLGSVKNITVEDARLKVVLPEGALNIRISTPFTPTSQTVSRFYTNLDTIGRPMVIIEKHNAAADEYAVPVQISYDYPSIELYRKPLVVSTAIFGLLLLGIVYARLDLSLVRDGENSAADIEAALSVQREEVTKVVALAKSAFDGIDDGFEQFRKTRGKNGGLKTFEAGRTEQKEKLDRCYARIRKAAQKVSVAGGSSNTERKDFVKGVEQIEKLVKEKLTKLVGYQDAVVQFLDEIAADVDGTVDAKKKEALQAKVIAFDASKKEIDAKLTAIFEQIEV
ncbi:hypothetical protein HK100_002872 [Physocladia obscura]|uniref:Dolichyl-diphosphooligosaccharide--protein glycosyltransferase subunit 1 n=1 Tax=Physocladia obscura TaxID=109957 RepID=A0AAD5SWY8_9FUNG|nr:hypothetical protein HK100_002872 [Physocladia obscura]